MKNGLVTRITGKIIAGTIQKTRNDFKHILQVETKDQGVVTCTIPITGDMIKESRELIEAINGKQTIEYTLSGFQTGNYHKNPNTYQLK